MAHDEIHFIDADNPRPGNKLCHCEQLLHELAKMGEIKNGEFSVGNFGHDEWCPHLRNPLTPCNCNPLLRFGDGREFEWAKIVKQS
jgi:hypothetical protein